MEQRSYRNHNFVFLKHQGLFGRRETPFVARAHTFVTLTIFKTHHCDILSLTFTNTLEIQKKEMFVSVT